RPRRRRASSPAQAARRPVGKEEETLMLIQWMSYATLIAALCACSALALEQVAAIWGFSRRMIWIAALGAATVAPLVLASRRAPAPASETASAVTTTTQVVSLENPARPTTANAISLVDRARRVVRQVNEYSLIGWLAASALLLLVVVKAAFQLHVFRRRWAE